jgi:hypothetical protein
VVAAAPAAGGGAPDAEEPDSWSGSMAEAKEPESTAVDAVRDAPDVEETDFWPVSDTTTAVAGGCGPNSEDPDSVASTAGGAGTTTSTAG